MENTFDVTKVDTSFLQKTNALIDKNETDDALQLIRDSGYTKAESMWILAELMNIEYKDAQAIVHRSKVWNDRFNIDKKTNDNFFDFIENLNDL